MPALIVCPHCNVHAKVGERRCPHCGGASTFGSPAALSAATALLLGLSLGACTSKKPPPRERDAETAGDVERPDAKADGNDGPDAKSDAETPLPLPAEPEYGLPEVDASPPAPAYGFAEPLRDDPPQPER